MKRQTTKKDFEIFKKECLKWIDFFGLKSWEFHFIHKDWEGTDDVYAYLVHPNRIEDRVFTIGLPVNIDDGDDKPIREYDIRKSAFHEVMEALLFRLGYFAKARYPAREDIDEETHVVVRTLENSIFPALSKKK